MCIRDRYDEGKIASAILRAMEAAQEGDASQAAAVANAVEAALEERCGAQPPQIEQIQDLSLIHIYYDFIEFMACPGGCVNGGGQPTQPASVRNFTDLKALRAAALYGDCLLYTSGTSPCFS